MIKCLQCEKEFNTLYGVRSHLRIHKSTYRNPGIPSHVQKQLQKGVKKSLSKRLAGYSENPQKCAQCTKALPYKKKHDKFCSSRCFGIHHNKQCKEQDSIFKKRQKKVQCLMCPIEFVTSFYTSPKRYFCSTCRKNQKMVDLLCQICSSSFRGREGLRTCSKQCFNIAVRTNGRRGGLATQKKATRRSKNEILFAELCESLYGPILCNQPIFNGWDADVILPAYKVAVLWDGVWHRIKVTRTHALKQVQNRDRMKHAAITACGYATYVICDNGMHNPKFVQEQFEKFTEYISVLKESTR